MKKVLKLSILMSLLVSLCLNGYAAEIQDVPKIILNLDEETRWTKEVEELVKKEDVTNYTWSENLEILDLGKTIGTYQKGIFKSMSFSFEVEASGYYSLYTRGPLSTVITLKSEHVLSQSDNGGHKDNACMVIYLNKGEKYTVAIEILNNLNLSEDVNLSYDFYIQKGLPLSGYEYPNAVKTFNHQDYRLNNNCYTYALGFLKNPINKQLFRVGGANPGEMSRRSIGTWCFTTTKFMKETVVSAAKLDALKLGGIFNEIDAWTMPQEGCYKIALVYAPGYDIHWIRQDNDGTWSHKEGRGQASMKDSKGNRITVPHQSDFGIYKEFIGYYEVSKYIS